jgi:hypothetical protein
LSARTPQHRYSDPLDAIWLSAATKLGFVVDRTAAAYATYNPSKRLISLGDQSSLDPDDCLAQMLLHELCHALVQGEEGLERTDWGLNNEGERDAGKEHACLRVQATLLRPLGLRRMLAPTTDYRAFYDTLPDDPLQPPLDETVILARMALRWVETPRWKPLHEALAATAEIARAAAGAGEMWTLVDKQVERHQVGFPLAPEAGKTCGDCGWMHVWRGIPRCRQADHAKIELGWAACERFETAADCLACGACCREAYGAVIVLSRDPAIRKQPTFIVRNGSDLEVRREGDRCAALGGDLKSGFGCTIYEDRPQTCRDFIQGGDHCLTARRRVGLSR